MLKKLKVCGAFLLSAATMSLIYSCQKENSVSKNLPQKKAVRFPQTDLEKQKVEKIKEVASILQVIYKDRKVREEVCAAISSRYYTDEFVLLKDLLKPETSPLFKTDAFKKFNVLAGIFKSKFREE